MMLKDWKELRSDMAKGGTRFRKINKEVVDGFEALSAVKKTHIALDDKTRELIALAVTVVTQCEACMSAHVIAAHKAGASAREVSEALSVAISLKAGSAWANSVKVLEAFEALDPNQQAGS